MTPVLSSEKPAANSGAKPDTNITTAPDINTPTNSKKKKGAPVQRKWNRLGVAPVPVLGGRAGARWPVPKLAAQCRERSVMLRPGASKDSCLTKLGAEVFIKIALLVADETCSTSTGLDTRQLRQILPLAITCRSHYAILRELARGLALSAPRGKPFPTPLVPEVVSGALLAYSNITSLRIVGPLSSPADTLLLVARLTPALRELRLAFCNGSNSACGGSEGLGSVALKSLRSLPNLEFLRLSMCGRLGEESGKAVGSLKNLAELHVYGCSGTDDEFFVPAIRAPKLRNIDIDGGMKFSDATLHALSSAPCAPQLESLTLSPCLNVTDFGLRALCKRATNLGELKLERAWRISFVLLVTLAAHIPALHTLHLKRSVPLLWYDPTARVKLRELRVLVVSGDTFCDAQAAILVDLCPVLEKFHVEQSSALSDDGLRDICSLPKLKHLVLQNCRTLTDTIVPIICSRSVPFQSVQITGSPGLSEDACQQLAERCTNVLHPFHLKTTGKFAKKSKVSDTIAPNLLKELWR